MGVFLDDLDFHLEGPTSKLVVLDAQLRYKASVTKVLMVPVGFICDLASVPKLFIALAPDWQQSARSGVLHDWLYRTGRLARAAADAMFRAALRSDGVGRFRAWAMYQAVRIGGRRAWRRYREAD